MPPLLPPGPDDVYSGSIGRWFGATAASATSGGCDGRSAARPRPTATATDVMRGCSPGGKVVTGLERREWTRLSGGPQTFFSTVVKLTREAPKAVLTQ
jgi:hypothetical protein